MASLRDQFPSYYAPGEDDIATAIKTGLVAPDANVLLTRDSDEVLARLEVLLNNRVGEPMEPGELEAARKETKRRIEAKIPPST
jgi:PIN like domain